MHSQQIFNSLHNGLGVGCVACHEEHFLMKIWIVGQACDLHGDEMQVNFFLTSNVVSTMKDLIKIGGNNLKGNVHPLFPKLTKTCSYIAWSN